MNDNRSPHEDDRTIEEWQEAARAKTESALRLCEEGPALGPGDAGSLSAIIRATAKYLAGAAEDSARAKALAKAALRR